MKVDFLTQQIKDKHKISIRFIVVECSICSSTWGISFPEKRYLTDNSFTCRNCSNKDKK